MRSGIVNPPEVILILRIIFHFPVDFFVVVFLHKIQNCSFYIFVELFGILVEILVNLESFDTIPIYTVVILPTMIVGKLSTFWGVWILSWILDVLVIKMSHFLFLVSQRYFILFFNYCKGCCFHFFLLRPIIIYMKKATDLLGLILYSTTFAAADNQL